MVVLGACVWDVMLASDPTCCPVAKKMLRRENQLAPGPYVLELGIEQCD